MTIFSRPTVQPPISEYMLVVVLSPFLLNSDSHSKVSKLPRRRPAVFVLQDIYIRKKERHDIWRDGIRFTHKSDHSIGLTTQLDVRRISFWNAQCEPRGLPGLKKPRVLKVAI